MVQDNWAYQSAQIAKTEISGEQSTDIEIHTADGDKVTLSLDIKFESSAVTYEELNRTSMSYSKSQGQIISDHANSELELTVEGTLDEQEKKEIKAVLMNLFKMVKDFLTGKADTEETHNFANLSTISEVKAEFDINVSITTAAQSYSNHVAQIPVEEKPAIQKVETANLSAVSERVDKLTDRMIKVVKDSNVEPSKILNRLNRRLSRHSRKFMNAGPANWHKMRLRQAILQDFIKKLKELSAENEAKINNKEQDDAEKAANPNKPAIVKTTSSVAETILNVASQDFHFEIEYSAADDN
jgi:hypothetical protein